MRVYKFLPCKYALRALRHRRLKISEVRHLNDPFDLLPFDLSDPEFREGIRKSREEIGRRNGLMCFSADWHNPVVWSHYAESHRGLCLGFETAEGLTRAIDYVDEPIREFTLKFDAANQMLFTKYSHWRYEAEIRMWAALEKKSGKFY